MDVYVSVYRADFPFFLRGGRGLTSSALLLFSYTFS